MFSFDESTEISARFHRKFLRKDFFTRITFHKSIHADFYGYLDVNFVVFVFDPNSQQVRRDVRQEYGRKFYSA